MILYLNLAKPCRPMGTPRPSTSRQEPDSDFVYEPESPLGSSRLGRHTRSMGSAPPPDQPAEPLHEPVDELDVPKPKQR